MRVTSAGCSADSLRVDLLILDELGFVPFDRTGGELLFNVLADRHGAQAHARHHQPRFRGMAQGLRRRREAHHRLARSLGGARHRDRHQRQELSDATPRTDDSAGSASSCAASRASRAHQRKQQRVKSATTEHRGGSVSLRRTGSVSFRRQQLAKAHAENRLAEQLACRSCSSSTSSGTCRSSGQSAHVFFELVSSILLTTNQPVTEWGPVFGDDMIAAAVVEPHAAPQPHARRDWRNLSSQAAEASWPADGES